MDSVGFHDANLASIRQREARTSEIRQETEEFAKEHAARFSRERRKNQELGEQILSLSTQKASLETAFASQSSEVESLKKVVVEKAEEVLNLKVELAGFGKKINAMKEKIVQTKSSIPLILSKMQDIEIQCQNEKERSQRIANDLSDYADITESLKGHFDRTIDALYTDKYERPWIEKGEMLKLNNFSLNLEKGLLGLPVGQEIGLEPGAFLTIDSLGETICKIKIMESSQNKSIGLIMPLFGKPEKLLGIQSFDIKHL